MPNNNRPPPTRPVQISKKLSWLLRHGATSENLPLQPGGYALVSDVLSNRKIKPLKVTFAELTQLVEENDKQRFSLIQDGETWLIRANQGHSLTLEGGTDGLLTPISRENGNVPGTVVHGTTHRAWCDIVASGGLKPMGRNHVHFASGLPVGFRSVREVRGEEVETPVISGMRNSSTVLVFVDLERAMEAGIKFGISENGVILTEGNADGIVPLDFFSSVEDRTGEGVLLENGKVVKEAPAAWATKGKGKGNAGRQS